MSNSRRVTTTSGNFDYPPASNEMSSGSTTHARSQRETSSEISRRLQEMTNQLRQETDELRRQLHNGHEDGEMPLSALLGDGTTRRRAYQTTTASHSTSPERRRRMRSVLRRIGENESAFQSLDPYPTPQNQSSTPSSTRPRATLGGRYRSLQSGRAQTASRLTVSGSNNTGNLVELREAGERLARVNEELRVLLERPLGSQTQARHSMPSVAAVRRGDAMEQEQRKRRRLDSDHVRDYPKIEYGYKGQVVPGCLNMKILSSDGGVLDTPGNSSSPENVLKDDSTVYCTKSSRCNMVLSHEGETTFHISKLVIKAPRSGFTDPVREALVFVAMKKDHTFQRTARYQITNYPTNYFVPNGNAGPPPSVPGEYDSSDFPVLNPQQPANYLHNGPVAQDTIPSFNRLDCELSSDEEYEDVPALHDYFEALANEDSGSEESSSADDDDDDQSEGLDLTEMPDELLELRRVATRNQARIAEESRRNLDELRRDPSNELGNEGGGNRREARQPSIVRSADLNELVRRGVLTAADRLGRRESLARTALERASTDPEISTAEATQETLEDPSPGTQPPSQMDSIGNGSLQTPQTENNLLTPTVRFSMRGQANSAHAYNSRSGATMNSSHAINDTRSSTANVSGSKMTIRFVPPLGARYILLKMWSPRTGGNIDIQNITCYGYAGPRLFPATELR